jgi:hypothetical protein
MRNKPTMRLAIAGPSATTPSAGIRTDPPAEWPRKMPGNLGNRLPSTFPQNHALTNVRIRAGATRSVCRQQKKEKR